ncbi:MAG: Mg-chelatase subunit ChlD [Sphingobacteriales bacterium]|jgi:Mg-chelatase subunit ChlD
MRCLLLILILPLSFLTSKSQVSADLIVKLVNENGGDTPRLVIVDKPSTIHLEATNDEILGIINTDTKSEFVLKDLYLTNSESEKIPIGEVNVTVSRKSPNGPYNPDVEQGNSAVGIGKKVGLVFVLDCSSSLGSEFTNMKNYAIDFINDFKKSSNSTDLNLYMGVVGFNGKTAQQETPTQELPLTQNLTTVSSFINGLTNNVDKTAFHYGISRGVFLLKSAGSAHDLEEVFLVSFTDGNDNESHQSYSEDSAYGSVAAGESYDIAFNDLASSTVNFNPIVSSSIGLQEGATVLDTAELKTFARNGGDFILSNPENLGATFAAVSNALITNVSEVVITSIGGKVNDNFQYLKISLSEKYNYLMEDKTHFISDGFFYDGGGEFENYPKSTTYNIIFYPKDSRRKVSVEFLEFDLSQYHELYISEGDDYTEGYVGKINDSYIGKVITSSHSNGALNFRFISDSRETRSGWKARIGNGFAVSVKPKVIETKSGQIYPNPAGESIEFILDENKTIKQLEFYDNAGRLLELLENSNQNQFNTTQYAPGIIHFKALDSDGSLLQGSFIKK